MEYIRSLIHGDHGHTAEAKSRSSSRDGSKMEITTPKDSDVAFGDLPTPVAPPSAAPHPPPPQQNKSSSRPPLSNSKPTDKKLESWKVGPRYAVSSILGKGSYGEVAGGIDTVT
jgi:hypothetical protein